MYFRTKSSRTESTVDTPCSYPRIFSLLVALSLLLGCSPQGRASFLGSRSHFRNGLLLTLSILAIFFSRVPLAFAQDITIGVPLVEEPINLVESSEPFAQIILSATSQPLLKRNSQKASGFQLLMVDSFSTSLDSKSLDLKLKAGLAFVNAKLVDAKDVNSSLHRCLIKRNLNKTVSPLNFSVFTRDSKTVISVASESGLNGIIDFVENCPIFEERSQRLFAKDMGRDNLVLGTGPYQLSSRIKNREAKLERVYKFNAWASTLTVRGFGNASQGLTALRTGTIDALYTQDVDVQDKAKNDGTLLIQRCGVYNIILRKGLEISCNPFLDPGSFKYASL